MHFPYNFGKPDLTPFRTGCLSIKVNHNIIIFSPTNYFCVLLTNKEEYLSEVILISIPILTLLTIKMSESGLKNLKKCHIVKSGRTKLLDLIEGRIDIIDVYLHFRLIGVKNIDPLTLKISDKLLRLT